MYRIVENQSGNFTLASEGGALARNTNGEVYTTPERGDAEEAAQFLNQAPQMGKRSGSHRMKSIFGAIG
jgi:hypothetical protein